MYNSNYHLVVKCENQLNHLKQTVTEMSGMVNARKNSKTLVREYLVSLLKYFRDVIIQDV